MSLISDQLFKSTCWFFTWMTLSRCWPGIRSVWFLESFSSVWCFNQCRCNGVHLLEYCSEVELCGDFRGRSSISDSHIYIYIFIFIRILPEQKLGHRVSADRNKPALHWWVHLPPNYIHISAHFILGWFGPETGLLIPRRWPRSSLMMTHFFINYVTDWNASPTSQCLCDVRYWSAAWTDASCGHWSACIRGVGPGFRPIGGSLMPPIKTDFTRTKIDLYRLRAASILTLTHFVWSHVVFSGFNRQQVAPSAAHTQNTTVSLSVTRWE